ncbi:MAG: hypothetical protein KDD40_09450 [Bdellovibrionales bacterium]|nr:hypothetical protein [Bdellovibrionales bacterium]
MNKQYDYEVEAFRFNLTCKDKEEIAKFTQEMSEFNNNSIIKLLFIKNNKNYEVMMSGVFEGIMIDNYSKNSNFSNLLKDLLINTKRKFKKSLKDNFRLYPVRQIDKKYFRGECKNGIDFQKNVS